MSKDAESRKIVGWSIIETTASPLHQQIRRRLIKLIKQTTVAYSTDTRSFSKVIETEPTGNQSKSTELRQHYDDLKKLIERTYNGTDDLIEKNKKK